MPEHENNVDEIVQPTSSGLLLDSAKSLSELPQFDLIFGGEGLKKDIPDWKALMPKFRNQGPSMWCTAFAACNIGSAFNKKETGQELTFSPFELFYRTGGSRFGNTLVNAASGMCQSFVFEEDMPTPVPDFWSENTHQMYKKQAVASQNMLLRGKPYAMKNFSVVSPSQMMLRKALELSPVMLAIGIGSNYWSEPAPRRDQYSAYHCNVLTNIDDAGNLGIFESLTPRAGYDGQHKLAPDYEILYALSFADLPNDWYEIQEKAKVKPFQNALEHYKVPRNFTAELRASQDFSIVIKQHPTLVQLAGSLWTVIVNALAYGGYSVTDILNHLTNIRRTGAPIFDLNEMRRHN